MLAATLRSSVSHQPLSSVDSGTLSFGQIPEISNSVIPDLDTVFISIRMYPSNAGLRVPLRSSAVLAVHTVRHDGQVLTPVVQGVVVPVIHRQSPRGIQDKPMEPDMRDRRPNDEPTPPIKLVVPPAVLPDSVVVQVVYKGDVSCRQVDLSHTSSVPLLRITASYCTRKGTPTC